MIIVIRSGYVGSLNGVWVELLQLLTVAGAIVAGAAATCIAAERLAAHVPLDMAVIEPVAFFVLTLSAWFLLRIVSRWIGRGFPQHAMAAWNQALGILLGLASGALVAGWVVWALVSIPWNYLHVSVQERSLTGMRALHIIQETARHAAAITGGAPATSHFLSGAAQ